jgi:radical SAM superfamily enzyme YgiQ (UPF0313 family)
MADVVFINPYPGGTGLSDALAIQPVGLAYMAAVLEKNDFKCRIIDAKALQLKGDQVLRQIPEGAKLVGIYVSSFTYDSAKHLSALIREAYPGVYIVLGGPLPTAAPEPVLNEIACDGLIRGEGEYAILRMMRNISEKAFPFDEDVSGACFFQKDTKVIIKNPVARIKDLDALPFPAYHLLAPFNTYKEMTRKSPAAPIVTSRGCSYNCIFCSKDVFKRKVTIRSAEDVLEEIDYHVTQHGIRQIDILDDNFVVNRSRTEAILDGVIERGYDLVINIQSGIRTELLDEALLDKMKRAGVYKLGFGIESADPAVLKICRKHLDLDRAANVVSMAKKKGFLVYGYFIIGLPGETDEGFNLTLNYAKELDFDVANFCLAAPLPGTELYRMVEKEGRFLIDTNRNVSSGFYDGIVFYEYGDVTEQAVVSRYRRAYKEFYSWRKKVRLLLKMRSLSELRWVWNSRIMVLKGLSRGTEGSGLNRLLPKVVL